MYDFFDSQTVSPVFYYNNCTTFKRKTTEMECVISKKLNRERLKFK